MIAALAASCAPELGETPFACSDGTCPEGYACQSAVCVKEGSALSASRPMRVVWINAAEMYWFPGKAGGATLVVNDGFTPSAHGIYEIVVGADGKVSAPRKLIGYGDEFPSSSAVVALDADRYAVATLKFPSVEDDRLTLNVFGVQREAPEGTTPAIEALYTEQQDYLGGAEPAYIGMVAEEGTIDVAWTRPTGGGSVAVTHLEQNGSVWQAARTLEKPLPPDVLPLSGDCLLWNAGGGARVLRVGFESFATLAIDADGTAPGEFVPSDDVPLYAWGDESVALRYGDEDAASGGYHVSYVLAKLDGSEELADEDAGYLQGALEPYTAVPYRDGVLIAPLSSDPAFPSLDVAFRSPSTGLTKVASVPRTSTDELYSARAFGQGGKVYVAWTSFHESLMDLWISTADMTEPP